MTRINVIVGEGAAWKEVLRLRATAGMIGDEHEVNRYLALAPEAGTRIIDAENRQIFEGDLSSGNWR